MLDLNVPVLAIAADQASDFTPTRRNQRKSGIIRKSGPSPWAPPGLIALNHSVPLAACSISLITACGCET